MRETRNFSVGGREKKRERKRAEWGNEREKNGRGKGNRSQRKEKKKFWLVGVVWCVGEIKRREKNGVGDAPVPPITWQLTEEAILSREKNNTFSLPVFLQYGPVAHCCAYGTKTHVPISVKI